jgi:glutamine amidotransferase
MCRFIAYSGESILMNTLIFDASNSLVQQSKKAKMRVTTQWRWLWRRLVS